MDSKTATAVREWVAKDGGDTERTAKWMARTLKVGGVKVCRQMVAEAMKAGA